MKLPGRSVTGKRSGAKSERGDARRVVGCDAGRGGAIAGGVKIQIQPSAGREERGVGRSDGSFQKETQGKGEIRLAEGKGDDFAPGHAIGKNDGLGRLIERTRVLGTIELGGAGDKWRAQTVAD